MKVEKIVKTFLSLALLTVFLPMIFVERYTVHYSTLGDKTYSSPRFELLLVPIFFIVMIMLIMLWRKELENWLEK